MGRKNRKGRSGGQHPRRFYRPKRARGREAPAPEAAQDAIPRRADWDLREVRAPAADAGPAARTCGRCCGVDAAAGAAGGPVAGGVPAPGQRRQLPAGPHGGLRLLPLGPAHTGARAIGEEGKNRRRGGSSASNCRVRVFFPGLPGARPGGRQEKNPHVYWGSCSVTLEHRGARACTALHRGAKSCMILHDLSRSFAIFHVLSRSFAFFHDLSRSFTVFHALNGVREGRRAGPKNTRYAIHENRIANRPSEGKPPRPGGLSPGSPTGRRRGP